MNGENKDRTKADRLTANTMVRYEMYCNEIYSSLLYSTLLYCTVLYCTVLIAQCSVTLHKFFFLPSYLFHSVWSIFRPYQSDLALFNPILSSYHFTALALFRSVTYSLLLPTTSFSSPLPVSFDPLPLFFTPLPLFFHCLFSILH